ncbi:MAG: hypothetical protein FWE67_14670 [Planctomycetaceae bacterium]|nr:hypothetical protein [Planctomycetaceae bacterium]
MMNNLINNLKNKLKNILPENFVNVLRFIGLWGGIAFAFFITVLFIAVLFRQNDGLFLPNFVLDFFAFVLLLLLGGGLMFYLRRSGYQVQVLYFILLGFIAPFPYFIIYTYLILLLDFAFFLLKVPDAKRSDAVAKNEYLESGEDIIDENVTQQLTRSKTPDGKERIEGICLAEFEDGQQTVSVHVPFCPPFAKEPIVEAYLIEVADAAVSVAQSQVFGVRFEIKRKSKTPADAVRFGFVAE